MNQLNRRQLRAIRRHHRIRLMAHWTPLIRWLHYLRRPRKGEEQKYQDILNRHVRLRLKTRKPCSCWMCGHVRRTEGPTRQEALQDLKFQEEQEELEQLQALARQGFNNWLASLPDDDWGDSFQHATPVHYDPETNEFVEDCKPPG